jgi:hypothetical protein
MNQDLEPVDPRLQLKRDERGRLIPVHRQQGRPSKLTPERAARVIQLISTGNYIETSCAAAGIDQTTYYHWIGVGRTIVQTCGNDPETWPSDLSPYERDCAQFFSDIVKANAEAEAYAVTAVRAAMGTSWQAAMTWLERKYPDRWKRRDELTTNPMVGPEEREADSIDEQALLRDPEATRLMHEALDAVAKARQQQGEG